MVKKDKYTPILLTDIERIINKSLDLLYSKDEELFINELCERSIANKFGLYFYQIMQEDICSDYDIDMEYNRHKAGKKTLPDWPKGAYPDLIVHRRGYDTDNLLVIEFKKWDSSKKDIEDDITKLEEFVDCQGEYSYKYGASIIFAKERKDVSITWVWVENNRLHKKKNRGTTTTQHKRNKNQHKSESSARSAC